MNKYLIGFDFDGVIINSKPVMEKAWNDVNKKFFLANKYPFSDYLKNVGKPFPVIMESMGLEQYLPDIMTFYFKRTSEYSYLIELYPEIKDVIIFCNNSHFFKTALITSKCKYRTIEIVSHIGLTFDEVITPEDTLRGKPFPDPLIYANKLLKIASTKSLYIGDMKSDFLAAKNAGWNYIHANWGYGEREINFGRSLMANKPTDIISKLEQYFIF